MVDVAGEDDAEGQICCRLRIADCGLRIFLQFRQLFWRARRAVLIDATVIASISFASANRSLSRPVFSNFRSTIISIQYAVSSHSSSTMPSFATKSARDLARVAAR